MAESTKVSIALIGAGMFGGDVHLRAYADVQRAGLAPNLGRSGLDEWTRALAGVEFDLVAVATRSEASAARSAANYKEWTGREPKAYHGEAPWEDVLRR